MTMEITCKFHEYEVLCTKVEQGIYECPICEAIAVVSHDPHYSNPADGVSWQVGWLSRGVRVEDVS